MTIYRGIYGTHDELTGWVASMTSQQLRDILAGPVAWMAVGAFLVWMYSIATSASVPTDREIDKRRVERQARAAALSASGPTVKSFQTPEGDVVLIAIPQTPQGSVFADIKRCVGWRDTKTNTSALHCDNDTDLVSPDEAGRQ